MTKTITVSDETYELIKSQVEKEESNKLQIKTLAGKVLFESEKTTLKEVLEEAVNRGAYLRGANLEGANLRDADFYHAKFYGRNGNTKIKKNQIDDFLTALGVVVEG